MSEPREPGPGDVWRTDSQIRVVISVGDGWFRVADRYWLMGKHPTWHENTIGLTDFGPPSETVPEWHFWFNLVALFDGDPSAWAAALTFAPEVFLLEVGEGEEKRQVVGLPRGLELEEVLLQSPISEDGLRVGYEMQNDPADGDSYIATGEWFAQGWQGGKWRDALEADFPTAVRAALKKRGKRCSS